MGNFGGAEMVVVLFIALLVLGPERLPRVARQAGEWIGKARQLSDGFQSEVRRAMDDPMSMGDVPFERPTKPNRASLPREDRDPAEPGRAGPEGEGTTAVPDVSDRNAGNGHHRPRDTTQGAPPSGDDTPTPG